MIKYYSPLLQILCEIKLCMVSFALETLIFHGIKWLNFLMFHFTGDDPLEIRINPELCRAFDVPIDSTFRLSEKSESHSLYRYFFFDHDFEELEHVK
jgi:hypothetical protein